MPVPLKSLRAFTPSTYRYSIIDFAKILNIIFVLVRFGNSHLHPVQDDEAVLRIVMNDIARRRVFLVMMPELPAGDVILPPQDMAVGRTGGCSSAQSALALLAFFRTVIKL